MAIATRNLYLVLKARDEASRVVRGFGRELSRAGKLAQAENLRSRASLATERAAYLQMTGAAQVDIDQQKLLAQQLRNQAIALERAHRQAVRFANALHTVSASVITVGSGLAIGGAAGLAFLVSSVGVARDYEAQVRRTATQVDSFKASLEDISKVGLDVAKNIAVPFEEIQPALYNILSSTNANLDQARILLEAFAKTAVAGQVSLEDASRGTIPILNAFNIPLEDVNKVLDIQFQLVRKGVGTYGEFASVFGRVVPSATRAGQTFEEVAAMLAYLTRNGLSAAMASSSAARALDALSNPTAVQNMENMGIKVRDLSGNFLPLEQILTGLREKLDALPQADRVAALVEVFKGAGGTIQARRFLEQVLLRPGELEEFIGFLGDMKDSTGQFQAAYETMAESVAAQSTLLRNKWKVLQESVGRIMMPIFLKLIVVLQKVADWFNNLSPSMQKAIVYGIAIASAFGIVAGLVLVLIGLFAGLVAAIMTAGLAFFYLIGALAAIVVGGAAVTAMFIAMYQKSQGFRDLLDRIHDSALKLYNEAFLPAAQGIRQAFEDHVFPALQKLWDFMEAKVIPVVLSLYDTFTTKIVPAAKEVANLIKDEVVAAFQKFQDIVEKDVIPILDKLVKYYNDHKEAVDTVVAALVFLGKNFAMIAAIMTGLLLGAFGTVIITTFTTFIATVFAIGAAVVWLIEHVKAIINWFKNLGNGVTETGGFFDRGKQYIADFVGKFAWAFQMLDAIWGFIVSLVKLGFTAVHFLFAWGLEIVQSAWETTWAMVGDTVKATWSFVFDFVKSIWDKIVSLATSQGETIRNVFTSVRDAVFDVMRSIFDFVKNILSDIGNWMYDSGRSIISGLINGITSRFNEARGVIEDITGWIKDHFPHSPAKIGPLSGSGGMFYAGQNIVKQLAQGIESARSMLRAPTAGVSLNARNSILAAPGPTGSNKQVNQNIVVHTQEINPVRQSAELGWLLAGRS